MTTRSSGQIRSSQLITTYGPGAMIDLPRYSAIVGGLEQWPARRDLQEIVEPRLSRVLQLMTGVTDPKLYAPPPDTAELGANMKGITAWRFPEWYVVQDGSGGSPRDRARRLVNRRALDNRGRFDGRQVVATRFVRACVRGHVDDINWHRYAHDPGDDCPTTFPVYLVERGTSGDLLDLVVRCECGKSRSLYEAAMPGSPVLGTCSGERPWLGSNAREDCSKNARLLIRTASNSYFPQAVSVLSLPNRGSAIGTVVDELWNDLFIVEDAAGLNFIKRKPEVTEALAPFADDEILVAIKEKKQGGALERPVKQVELDALLAVEEGFHDDVPIDRDFHARRLPDRIWRRTSRTDGIAGVTQLHRMRAVIALAGFTRFEAVMPDIDGEYDNTVERADIAVDPQWFPAVENHGEGIFVQLSADTVETWLGRDAVKERLRGLIAGHTRWNLGRRLNRSFPGGPYVLLHTFSHLLLQSLAISSGYPASSIAERIYVDDANKRYGILLYTASADSEGTLGGLVQQARFIEDHVADSLRMSGLCSNDPVCSHHVPGESMEGRLLHGAACHGCALISETSCEMRNDYLDRALIVPVLGHAGAAFFAAIP